MARGGGFVDAEDGRLSARLAETLDSELHDALDHPVRREVLRALNQNGRARTAAEISAELRPFRLSQVGYHLQVLRRSGTVASGPADLGGGQARARYASEVGADGRVRAVLRATERSDRERREAAIAAGASPLLTMFRVPRPVRTIRLGGRRDDAERGR